MKPRISLSAYCYACDNAAKELYSFFIARGIEIICIVLFKDIYFLRKSESPLSLKPRQFLCNLHMSDSASDPAFSGNIHENLFQSGAHNGIILKNSHS